MGIYLRVPHPRGKVAQLEAKGARIIDPVWPVADPTSTALVCVVENESWDAALFCTDRHEFERTTGDLSGRPKTYLAMPLDVALGLCDADQRPRALREHLDG